MKHEGVQEVYNSILLVQVFGRNVTFTAITSSISVDIYHKRGGRVTLAVLYIFECMRRYAFQVLAWVEEKTGRALEREDPVIYKLLFRIVPPPKGPAGRVGPRLLWSLVSLSRRNTVDQAVSGSPIVTRLNVESLEYKYLTLVLKVRPLHLLSSLDSVLSGYPTRCPVWVFGLTHSNELEDVTSRANCHAGDDTVIHFPRDSCSAGLLFSGGELSGSSGLALVTKLDRSSAQENIVVWFPKPYTVNLVVDTPKAHNHSPLHEYSTETTLLRALIEYVARYY
ncbi:unnamed protein product [Dibothriocephalus latus]|uniref:Transmembrane protein family 132 fourth domain-containing protein n=1 Tax=Dibothriocephalus latus TaxID=60516 RepID=A0A3P6S0T1_DIBLA|nr:unnamed protein product [Dibothriocephalus latus]